MFFAANRRESFWLRCEWFRFRSHLHLGYYDGIDFDRKKLLAGEVEREVLAGLEKAELSDLLCRNTAGGEVGNTAGGKLDANVGDVDLAREDGQPDGADFVNGRLRHCKDDVEVVDHEIQHDVDVERTRREDAEPVRLKEHGALELLESGSDGGIEAFKMADRNDPAEGSSERDDVVGLRQPGGEGLFDEDVEAGLEQLLGHGGMMDGRDANGGGVDAETCMEQISDGSEAGDRMAVGGLTTKFRVGLNKGRQSDGIGICGLEFAIDAKVIAAERTGSDDGYAKRGHGYFLEAAAGAGLVGDSTASRQRA
jgi:hypothetical protein